MRALAERYLGRRPCPTKLDPSNRREEALVHGIRENGAEGGRLRAAGLLRVSFLRLSGLEASGSTAEGIPSVRLDLEHPFQPTGQMRTRPQALSEMLAEGR